MLVPEISIILISVLQTVALIFADFFAFNGVTSKENPFGLLRCTLNGKGHLRKSLMADNVLRFLNIVIVNALCAILFINMVQCNFVHEYLMLYITMTFLVYASVTFALLLVRSVTSFLNYMGIVSLLNIVLGGINYAVAGYLYVQLHIMPLWPCLITGVVLSVVGTYLSNYVVMKNYDRSFQEDH